MWHTRFADGRDSLADDEREGRPSFRESDPVKNEVRDVINGDRRLTVREVADKCRISKTTAHQILGNDLNMNRVCARWVTLTPKRETTSCLPGNNPIVSR